MEIGVFLNCNAHRSLAYAVQQIITQELEVERLKRASILTGLGVNSENMAKSGNPETVENVQNISSNVENNTKQSRKNATSLKEIVSFMRFSFYCQSLYTQQFFRYTKTFSEISLRMKIKMVKNRIK